MIAWPSVAGPALPPKMTVRGRVCPPGLSLNSVDSVMACSNVEQLALVFVHALDLTVEERVG